MNLMKLLLPNSADVNHKLDDGGLHCHSGKHNGENCDVLIEPINLYPMNNSGGTIYDSLSWDGVCNLQFIVNFS
jgi:hypothetical protein